MSWSIDSSTFIHALLVSHEKVLSRVRPGAWFIEYVFRVELTGDAAHIATSDAAQREVDTGAIALEQLTVEDVVRMSALAAPRRKVDVGELATAVVADRLGAGVLCDDRTAVEWLRPRFSNVSRWESIETVLVDAALNSHIAEHLLPGLQTELERAKYVCTFNLHEAYGQRWFEKQQAAARGK